MPKRTNVAALAAAAHNEETRPAPGAAAMRSAPMRTSIDLDPMLRGRLNSWRIATAAELERQDVPLVAIVRALLDLLLSDDNVSTAVKDALKQ